MIINSKECRTEEVKDSNQDHHRCPTERPKKTQDPITKNQILQHEAPIAKITRYYCTKHPKPEKQLITPNREATVTNHLGY
ncbi:hypothetical protein B9Z55_001483 [Caenorhabditis nigoni]|uniref:Uncharacterized protein n=1 Tax=Caenorhabditis nigoni TaxID=1611254 RepID=A0A2G5V3Z3_9PELO|nr:hypothetical protein B9Z55_006173 [Caenorhabditis nigoni]PIC50665.1 hypothetical protein B9Z55_001483 [Caenorhabditis nigoni]